MRRKDREVTDKKEILQIMKKCEVCNIALFGDRYPYIVPLNFGVALEEDQFVLYFHGANAGHKLELIRNNSHAAFEMDCAHRLLLDERACDATMEFESVCGNGIIEILDENEKITALTYLMNQYSKSDKHEFHEKELQAVSVLKLTVNEITGKMLKKS